MLKGRPGQTEFATQVHEATAEEVSLSELEGPFTEEHLTSLLGTSQWLACPRFGVMQQSGYKTKLRLIDDCKASGLNDSFTVTSKIRLQDLDYVVAFAHEISKCVQSGKVRWTRKDGSLLTGEVHPSVRSDCWFGRTLDLSRACGNVQKTQMVAGVSTSPTLCLSLRPPQYTHSCGLHGAYGLSCLEDFSIHVVLTLTTSHPSGQGAAPRS